MIESLLLQSRFFAADACKPSILGIQGWQKYLTFDPGAPKCELKVNDVGFVWLVVAGLLDALLRISALVAVGFFLYGGFKLITSQGSPENVKAGKETMKNAIIGLVICLVGIVVQSVIMGVLVTA